MNEIVRVLMERDCYSEAEAREVLDEVREEVQACLAEGDMLGAEDAFCDGLGLELDYIDDLL